MDIKLKISKTEREGSRILLAFFILLLTAVFLALSFLPKKKPPVSEKKEESHKQDLSSKQPPALQETEIIVQKGKTLSDILAGFGLSPSEIHRLQLEVKPVYDLAKIKAGQKFRIITHPDGSLAALEYDLDQERFLHIRKEQERYQADIIHFPYETKVRMISGVIEDNPISSVNHAGEKDFLALMLSEIFAWDIDFYTDLRQGDTFKIVFEKRYLEGQFSGYGNILAAEFINRGQTFRAIRYTYADTSESDYFDAEGKSLRKEFLKSPLSFARITSRFSHSRLHPIRKIYRAHYGVDYAARVGTPVQATADGTITFADWNGASGRMAAIRHNNSYETMYLHLRKFAKGIRKGAKVKQGQEIGYVGSSGESTGPHLDYRIKHGGRYINPLAHRFRPVQPLRPEFQADFQQEAEKYTLFFETHEILFALFDNPFGSGLFSTEQETENKQVDYVEERPR